MNEILEKCRRLSPKKEYLTKMDKNNKFKMAAAANLNFIYCSKLVYYCTHLQEKIWHVYCVKGPTCMYAKKSFVCLFVCLWVYAITRKVIDRSFWNFEVCRAWHKLPVVQLDSRLLWNFRYHCVKGGISEPLAKRRWWRHLANSFALAEVPAGYDCFLVCYVLFSLCDV